jgi:hypothetical protein
MGVFAAITTAKETLGRRGTEDERAAATRLARAGADESVRRKQSRHQSGA